MGLFDRFKKRVEETEEAHGITAEEGTPEAIEALAERDRLQEHEARSQPTEAPPTPRGNSGWDDIDEELNDPFSTPPSAMDRKRATRERIAKEQKRDSEEIHRGPMQTTTGRDLVEVIPTSFAIDLGDDTKTRGGRILKGGPALEKVLEELETDLLTADMGHTAATELTSILRTHLIGARIARKAELAGVVERALRGALRNLLKSGYWDFDRTVQAFVAEETPVSIMIVGVNGTGKTTTTAKIAKISRLRRDFGACGAEKR